MIPTPFFSLFFLFFFCSSFSFGQDDFDKIVPSTDWPYDNNTLCLPEIGAGVTPFPLWFDIHHYYSTLPNYPANLCLPGFYCPYMDLLNNATWPASCPPSPDCSLKRSVMGRFCDIQSKYEPIVCPPGFYCPSYNQKFICPKNYYCPLGSVLPKKCSSLSVCPEGAKKERFIGSFIAVIIVDILLYLFAKGYNYWATKEDELFQNGYSKKLSGDEKDKPLIEAFKKARTTHNNNNNNNNNNNGNNNNKNPIDYSALTVSFDNLRVAVHDPDAALNNPEAGHRKKEKVLLDNVSGEFRSSTLTAILGPAGCGKTTLLTALQGHRLWDEHWTQSGTVSLNNINLSSPPSLSPLAPIIGYVPQEDILHKELTVRQNIAYSAMTRLPAIWTNDEKNKFIDGIIDALGLSHVRASRVGDELTRGVSGGQRKRTSIAIELAAAPSLLLLDEVTSGLDSNSSLELIRSLQRLARTVNLTVGMVIQQPRPEIWSSLDQVLFLAAGGRSCYQGPQKLAEIYFLSIAKIELKAFDNPANTILDNLSNKKLAGKLASLWANDGKIKLGELVTKKALDDGLKGSIVFNKNPLDYNNNNNNNNNNHYNNNNVITDFEKPRGMGSSVSEAEMVVFHRYAAESIVNSSPLPPIPRSLSPTKNNNNNGNNTTTPPTPNENSLNNSKHKTIQIQPSSMNIQITEDKEKDNNNNSSNNNSNNNNSNSNSASDSSPAATPMIAVSDIKLDNNNKNTNTTTTTTTNNNNNNNNTPRKLSFKFPGRSASFLSQIYYSHIRAIGQQVASYDSAIIEILVCVLIGSILGISGVGSYRGSLIEPYSIISPTSLDQFVSEGSMYICMTIALAATVAGVNVFGRDISIINREKQSGHNIIAYYIGHSSAQIYRMIIMALHFSMCYTILFQPKWSYGELFSISFLLFFNYYALSQLFSFLLSPLTATLFCVMITLIISMFNGFIIDIPYRLKILFAPWWASSAFFTRQTESLIHIFNINQTINKYGYHRNQFSFDLGIMFIIGFIYQLLAMIICYLVFYHKTDKWKNYLVQKTKKCWNMIS